MLSSSIRLFQEKYHNDRFEKRPLSPVRIRTKLPDDIKVEAPQLWIRSAMRMKSRP